MSERRPAAAGVGWLLGACLHAPAATLCLGRTCWAQPRLWTLSLGGQEARAGQGVQQLALKCWLADSGPSQECLLQAPGQGSLGLAEHRRQLLRALAPPLVALAFCLSRHCGHRPCSAFALAPREHTDVMAATVAALGFRGPLAAPGRRAGFTGMLQASSSVPLATQAAPRSPPPTAPSLLPCAACRPLRKSNLHRQAAPLPPPPRQTPPPAAAPRRWAPPTLPSWATPDPSTPQGRLFMGGIMLLGALLIYLCGSPTDAVYLLAIALIVMFFRL